MGTIRRIAVVATLGAILVSCSPPGVALSPADAVARYETFAGEIADALAPKGTWVRDEGTPRARLDGEICRYDAGVWRPAEPMELPTNVKEAQWQEVNALIKPVLRKNGFGNGRLSERMDGSVLQARDRNDSAFLFHADGSFSVGGAHTTASPCTEEAFGG